jgi:hypothetical protein
MFVVIAVMVFFVALISWSWVRGIDYMKENHPDYKGEDFLDWGEDDVSKIAGRDGWDDTNIHSEGDF